MFQVGDRVRKRHFVGDPDVPYSLEGTVVDINGRWIHVRHDKKAVKVGPVAAQPPRFDYQAHELEHLNPLLKFVRAL